MLVSSLDDSNWLQLDNLLTDTGFMTWTPNTHVHMCLHPFLALYTAQQCSINLHVLTTSVTFLYESGA